MSLSTTQEIVDHVARHLLTQGKRSMRFSEKNGKAECAYRGEGGAKCAIGCLIDDGDYVSLMEGKSIYIDDVTLAVQATIHRRLSHQEIDILMCLQKIHDIADVESWQEELWRTYKALNLTPIEELI